MNTNSNINAANVLETLHPATVKAIEGLYFQKFVAAMSSTISAPAAAAAVSANDTEQPVKRQGRPKGSKNKAKDDSDSDIGPSGRAKTASQVIRDYDEENPEAKATEVVAHCHALGLKNVVPANIYNVRQNLKKAAEAEAEAKAAKKAAKAKAAAKTGKKASKKASKKGSK